MNRGNKLGFTPAMVQPMIKAEGYELTLGSSIDVQFGPALLFGSGDQLVVRKTDCSRRRVVLHPSAMREEDLPRPVIRRYPAGMAMRRRNGSPHPSNCPEDEPLMVRFHAPLSERSYRVVLRRAATARIDPPAIKLPILECMLISVLPRFKPLRRCFWPR